MDDITSLLENMFLYLLAAVLAVPGARRLGLGSVLGYLLAGVVIGPWGLALIREAEHILHFAEFGVVMLLFLIGLELRPSQLRRMRDAIFMQGGAQVAASAGLIFLITLIFEYTWRESLVIGLALSLSSTAIGLQLLRERNLVATAGGQSSVAILLFQDMAVIPMLAVVPLLGLGNPSGVTPGWDSVLLAALAVLLIIVAGRYLLRHAYRYIASTQMPEMFTAFSLLLVISIALLMHSVGLSMALGAFLGGVLMADSEYRHEIESDIEPFKGLLLGLFFISVGMTVDFGLLLRRPVEILALLLVLLSVKAVVVYVIATLTRLPLAERRWLSVLLSQSGEFAFVLLGVATTQHAIPGKLGDMLIVVVALSMLTTPFLLIALERCVGLERVPETDPVAEDIVDETSQVIIAGFGRVGQIVGRLLIAGRVNVTVLDHDPAHIELVRRFGFQVYYGDALRLDLLKAAGAAEAEVLVIAIDDRERALELVDRVRQSFPRLKIVARAWDMPHQWQLMQQGVDMIQRETFAAAVLMGEDTLNLLGRNIDEIERLSEAFRDHDEHLLHQMYQARTSDERLTISKRGREEFTRLMEGDLQRKKEGNL